MPEISFSYKSSQKQQVACPICGSLIFTKLCSTDRFNMGVRTVGCDSCGFVMTNPQLSPKALDEFYTHHYRAFYQSVSVPDESYIRDYEKDKRAEIAAEFIAANLEQPPKSILDFGCSEGTYLKNLKELYPAAKGFGIEPNPEFRNFAEKYADSTCFKSLDELESASSGPFDLIMMTHVLEHIQDIRSVLLRLYKRLSPGGCIYIDVPDLEAYSTPDEIHIAHLWHFDLGHLRMLFEQLGFNILIIEKYSPQKHPKSIRMLCNVTSAVKNQQTDKSPVPESINWRPLKKIQRKKYLYQFLKLRLIQKLIKLIKSTTCHSRHHA